MTKSQSEFTRIGKGGKTEKEKTKQLIAGEKIQETC